MSRITRFRILGLFTVILLVVLPTAACGENQPAAVAVNPTAVPATPPPTAVATAAPTAVPTPTPTARFTVVGVDVQSGWRPPTIEEATMQQPSLGGEIPAELQWFVAAARADVGSTGYPDAVVSMVTNQGLVTDENDFRAAVTLTLPDGTKLQARRSGFPTQLNPDGTFKSNYEYYQVPGSVDARYIWTPGIGTDAPVELSLVKHTTESGAALLYWSDVEQSWQPVQGYEAQGNVVRVGDELFRYSPEDGSAVSLGGFEGMTSFAVDAQTGEVKARDANGAEHTLVDEGQWLTEAQVETAEMVEYLDANRVQINHKPMSGIEIYATNKVQKEMWEQLPEELQAKGENPLYVIVTNEGLLRQALDNQFVSIVGQEGLTSLKGRLLRISFLSASEEEAQGLPYSGGDGGQSTGAGAYEREDGVIELVIGLPKYLSTNYRYDENENENGINTQLIWGLQLLQGRTLYSSALEGQFNFDSKWDDFFLGMGVGRTQLLVFVNAEFRESNPILLNSGFLDDLSDSIPIQYR
jgi:hypothetical protein